MFRDFPRDSISDPRDILITEGVVQPRFSAEGFDFGRRQETLALLSEDCVRRITWCVKPEPDVISATSTITMENDPNRVRRTRSI